MKFQKIISAVIFCSLSACTTTAKDGSTTAPMSNAPTKVTLLAYDAFTPEEGIFDSFTRDTGITVSVVTGGDSGALISKAILTAGNPEGDVLWGLDNTMLSRAQKAKLLLDYKPVDTGDICINADKNWFSSRNLAVPTSFEDLTRPAYKGLLATQDPVASSPGLGFLMATIAHFGNDTWQKYWTSLLANNVHISPDWTTAYTIDYSGGSGKGKYPLVVSYGSSPPAEVLYSDPSAPLTEPVSLVIESTCFRQTEYVGVLRGSQNEEAASRLVNFLLASEFQESMPLSLFVYPVNLDAKLPTLFTQFAVKPSKSLEISPEIIEANRDTWLSQWRELAL